MTDQSSPIPTAAQLTPREAKPKPKRHDRPRARILEAIRDMTETNRVATRQVLAAITGLPMAVVDDHIKTLKADGEITAPMPGVFEPADQGPPDRAVSLTLLPTGGRRAKLEIGDFCVDLTLREARAIGELAGGIALRFSR